ncbi:hypothetical protein ULG90_22550 [Halopseudomonas pachastrellae]|nr:hypothetical protein ULG90_22550 [Halopseudomonas pachastrellae]
MRANRGALPLYAMTASGDCPEQAAENLPLLQQDRADFARAVTCQLPDGEARVTVEQGAWHVCWCVVAGAYQRAGACPPAA